MALRIPFNQMFWNDYLAGQESNLPLLGDVEQLTGRVTRILGSNPGQMQLQGTNTYLVGTGASRILIDTGEGKPEWIERITKHLAENHLGVSHVLLTHWHGDHTGGVPDLIAHDPEIAARVYKNQPDRGQKPIADGQVFAVEGGTVRAVFAPGHAVDHMCFRLEEENALFTGDNVLGHGHSVVQDLGVYMQSLARMAAVSCAKGYPAHGAEVEDLPAKMVEYSRHWDLRVRQVYSALVGSRAELERRGQSGRGAMTVGEIVKAIYGDLPREVVECALEPPLNQVLWKLAEDKRVGFEPGDTNDASKRWFANRRREGPSTKRFCQKAVPWLKHERDRQGCETAG